MTIADAQACYRDLSSKASDLVRQLAFAGLAVIWIFRVEHPGEATKLPHSILIPGGLIVAALLFDFCQYVYGTAAWGLIGRAKEKALSHDQDAQFYPRREINWPSIGFFWSKIVTLGAAYIMLLVYVSRQFF